MAVKSSTGLRNKLLDNNSFRATMNLGFVKIYSGTPPAIADDAIGGGNTLLCTISNNNTATGLTFEAVAVGGALFKTAAEVWSGINAAGGVATFYRHVAVGDTGVLSTTQARVQGTISVIGDDMNLTSTTLINGSSQTLPSYAIYLPTP